MEGRCPEGGGGGGEETPIWKGGARGERLPYKKGGMLVESLRGVNFGFLSHLGCFGQNGIICSRENLL